MKSNVTPSDVEDILNTYEFEEILELNDLSLSDALFYLVDEGYVELPSVKPLTWVDPLDVDLASLDEG